MTRKTESCRHGVMLATLLVALVWSGIRPADRPVWFMETLPVMVGALLLVATYRHFRLSNLVYFLIWVHGLILVVGGHYTYAEVPLFDWLAEAFNWQRNHYDRLGHFAQGFVPAMIAREILIRKSPLAPGGWLFFLVTSFCLAFSAFYELIEWWVAVFRKESAAAFLGTQGDVWDSQWDMFLALIGAVLAQALLRSWHNTQLRRSGHLPRSGSTEAK